MLYVTDDTIKEFNNCDLKIKEVNIDRYPSKRGWVLSVYAWAVPKVQWFEEGNTDWFITSGSDMIKPVGYRILIPFEMYYKSQYEGLNELFEYIDRSLPPLFEKCRFEILDKVAEFMNSRTI